MLSGVQHVRWGISVETLRTGSCVVKSLCSDSTRIQIVPPAPSSTSLHILLSHLLVFISTKTQHSFLFSPLSHLLTPHSLFVSLHAQHHKHLIVSLLLSFLFFFILICSLVFIYQHLLSLCVCVSVCVCVCVCVCLCVICWMYALLSLPFTSTQIR